MLGEGQYELSRNGKSDGKVYLQENFLRFPDTENVERARDTIRAPRGEIRRIRWGTRRDQDSTEKVVATEKAGVVVGPFRTLLSIFGLGERPLGKGKTRVRWGCVCGCNMYDDFTELRSGAAAELEKWLNDSMRTHAVSEPSNPPQNANSGSAASQSAPNSGYQQTEESDIPLQPWASTTDTLPGSDGNAAIAVDIHLEKCWLLLCGKLKRGPDSLLTQLDLSSTPSDKKLFEDLKIFYSSLRNTWTLRPFLRGVKTIRFVQVIPSNETNNSKSS